MVYHKYIKRGNKLHGPYTYRSVRVGNKVVTEYVGKEENASQKKKKFNLLWLFAPLVIIAIILLFVFKLPLLPTAKIVLELPPSYQINGTMTGKINLNMKHGELIPKDSVFAIKLNEQAEVVPISEIISISETEGDFYAENTGLTGEGKGYGFIGEKKVYPDISFEVLVLEEGEKVPEEAPTEEQGGEEPEPAPEEAPAEEQGGEEPEIEEEPAPVTGEAISELGTIKGEVSALKEFQYDLGTGQKTEIVKGSVKIKGEEISEDVLNLKIKDGKLTVSTKYYEGKEGFGADYLTEETETISIDLEQFNFLAELGVLKVELIYNDITLLSLSEQIKIEGVQEEEAEEVPENITEPEINITPELNITTNITIPENITEPEINITEPEINITEPEINITIPENITITTQQYKAILGKPVKWQKNVKIGQAGLVKIELPKLAENISVYKVEGEIEEELEIGEQIPTEPEVTEQVGEVEKEEEKAKERVEVKEENIKITEKTITGKISAEIELEKKPLIIRFFSRIFRAITGRTITTEEMGEVKEVTIEENALEYDIEYYTEAPISNEEETERGKKIIVSGPETITYENILAFTQLPKEAPEQKVKLYHLVNNIKEDVNITKQDLNNNSLIDYIEWVVPSLSNQTYELVIEISKAEHLDENKNFISDIYEEVKALDDIWSEEINNNEYVRVTFTQPLDNTRDITLYPRIILGNPRIQVYEVDGSEVIAEFDSLTSNQYNKVLLTNLVGSQDTFDLKILDGSLEIDHIVDPITTYYPNSAGSNGWDGSTVNTSLTTLNAINDFAYAAAELTAVSSEGADSVTSISTEEGAACSSLTLVAACSDYTENCANYYVSDGDGTFSVCTVGGPTCDVGSACSIYVGHQYLIDIAEAANTINNITSRVVVNDSNAIIAITYSLLAWNYTSSAWVQIGSSICEDLCSQSGIIYDATNFVNNSGDFYLAVFGASAATYAVKVHYVEVNVSYTEAGGDANKPFVFLKAPPNGTSTSDSTIYFAANFTDDVALKNATLIIYNSTHNEINRTENRTLSGTADTANLSINNLKTAGEYYWNYEAWDAGGNYATNDSNFTLNLASNFFSECINITQPGRYIMTADITNSVVSRCINISAGNVSLDCRGHTIDGNDAADYGIYIWRKVAENTNITIMNCTLSDWDTAALYNYRSSGNVFTNITAISNLDTAIYLDISDYNNLTDINVSVNRDYGIYLTSSDYNAFKNIKASNHKKAGIYLRSGSQYNEFINITANDNYYGIQFQDVTSTNNIITNSTIKANTYRGIYLYYSNSNEIYNNFFNNSINLRFTGRNINYWNVTKTSVTNIIGGSNIGGNFWADTGGNGFSENCADANGDSICDNTYTLLIGSVNNIDYLPLAITGATGDTEVPKVIIGSPVNNSFLNGNVTIKVWASDNIGVKNITLYYRNSTESGILCSDTVSPYSCVWDTSLFSNSSEGYDINATAYDVNGNVNESTRHYTIDRTKPRIDYIYGLNVTYPSGQTSAKDGQIVILRVNVTDSLELAAGINTSVVDLSNLNGSFNMTMTLESGSLLDDDWSLWNISVIINTTTGVNLNQKLARLYVYDNATTNNLRDSDAFGVQVDNNIPTYAGFSGIASEYNNTEVGFLINLWDNYDLDRYIFGSNLTGAWVNDSAVSISGTAYAALVSKTPVLEGNWTYKFYFYDDAGSMNETSYGVIEILGNAPDFVVYLRNPPDEASLNYSRIDMNFSYENGIAKNCSLYLNGLVNSTLIDPANYTVLNFTETLADGDYGWYVECYENITENIYTSSIRTFIVDTTKPILAITYPANTTYNYDVNILNYTYTETNLDKCWYSNDTGRTNSSFISSGVNFTGVTSIDGSNTWILWCNDTASNENSTSVMFARDTTKPIISDILSTPGETSVIITWTTDENANSSVYYGETVTTSSSTGSASLVTSHSLDFGGLTRSTRYYYNVSSCDAVGNCNFSVQYSFTTTSGEEQGGETGGGGGGGSTCTENWQCTNWSECIAGLKRRGCTDLNSCETAKDKPETQINCEACKENWKCTLWSECVDDKQTRSCEDENDCGTEAEKPEEERDCWTCEEDWKCDWTDCVGEEGKEYAYPVNCTDLNGCGTGLNKPFKTRCEEGICFPRWQCEEWRQCVIGYNLREIVIGEEKFNGIKERECVDLNKCHARIRIIEKQRCNLTTQVEAYKVKWCDEEYVEISEKATKKLVSRVKTTNITEIKKVNIGFIVSNFTGYCDYCYDGSQDYDEEKIDCGGDNCPECVEYIGGVDYLRFIMWGLWLSLLLLVLTYLIYKHYSKEEYRKKREVRREKHRKEKLLKKIEEIKKIEERKKIDKEDEEEF